MPCLQELADIAARWATAMADAMLAACAERAARTGEALSVPRRAGPAPARGARPAREPDWGRMVRRNAEPGYGSGRRGRG